jgi:hypothetical protein
MFLDYFALGMLFFVVITLFYAVIAIHDVPYDIAKRRQHPHQDAIHAAGWVSLFTLHALWPFLWIWSMAYRPDRGWGFSGTPAGQSPAEPVNRRLQISLADFARLLAAPAHASSSAYTSGACLSLKWRP